MTGFPSVLVFTAGFLATGTAWAATAVSTPSQPDHGQQAAPVFIEDSGKGFHELEQLLKLRDPFKRMQPKMGGPTGPRSPLEAYPVDAYRMVGVLTGPTRLRAMVVDPTGKSHLVSEKAKMGLRGGEVLRIRGDRLVVREKVTNLLGQVENVDLEIPLEGETKAAVVTHMPSTVTQADAPKSGDQQPAGVPAFAPGKPGAKPPL